MHYAEYKKIPNGLRQKRLEYGFKQKQVAEILGLKNSTKISRWENGACLPTLITAFKLAGLYSVFVEDIFFDLMDVVRTEVKASAREVLENRGTVTNQE